MKNSIPIKRGHKAKLNTGGGTKRSGSDSESMTHSRRQLNREESNAIPNVEGCGACRISRAGCRVMIHAGAIVNMRIGPMHIEKNDRRNNAW